MKRFQRLRRMFRPRAVTMMRALSSRNYRLFFSGQAISLIGTWMTRIATSWLVYRLTHSAFLLGFVGFVGQVPMFFASPFAGTLLDRWNLRKVVMVTQILATVQSLTLAVLALTGTIQMWHIIALSVFQGLINAFDMPARQAFMVEMIEKKDDLGNAIALNSSIVNGARLIGPSLAGIIIAAVGEGACFLIDGISYFAVIWALWAMKLKSPLKAPTTNNFFHDFQSGIRYAFGFSPIRSILFLLALVSFMVMPFTVLMPVYAAQVLRGGPQTLGFLMGASGLGALAGALYLAMRKTVIGLGRIIPESTLIFGISLVGFAFSDAFWLSFGLVLLAGFGMMVQLASSNTILQTIVDDDKRGRVMSFYVMAFAGMAPFGSLFAGGIAKNFGTPPTLLLSGVACLIGAFLFFGQLPELRKLIRPIYVRKGIIRQAASGVQTASQLTSSTE